MKAGSCPAVHQQQHRAAQSSTPQHFLATLWSRINNSAMALHTSFIFLSAPFFAITTVTAEPLSHHNCSTSALHVWNHTFTVIIINSQTGSENFYPHTQVPPRSLIFF